MVAKPSLDGLRVLITRPQQQAKDLCEMVEDAGGIAIPFPVINIKPIATQNWSNIALAEQDMIIFVSRNAVTFFIAGIEGDLPVNIQLVAVGAATATSMSEHGLRVDIQPPEPAGSESLLAMPALNNVKDKKVLIVRGQGGRELLADTLTTRGAKISYIEIYQRSLSTPSNAQIEQAKTADCILVTSIAGLDNLSKLIDGDSLKSKKLIVVSERIRQYAIQDSFQNIVVADDASDVALIHKLNRMEQNDGKS
ncbi:MAG: uroporphyrinogen-III synthase [Gammaproteobacteria bacterium]|nr:MAG: uroporphyrinogen-III synthase [Gammaproteobacteria bacterium]RKZ98134.1 MAG: uroporphyrinogen-III synthase [Gammaproteobacteria bacterium]RLA01191.1 MAG: uroporphyrinogen-III synthase [Gammaproteobacteria bacterium]